MKITNHKLCQFIVKKFVKKNIVWPKEIKIAKTLIQTYKYFKYWNNVTEVNLPSLAWFLTDDGKNFLSKEYLKQKLKFDQPENIPLKENKVGEDKKVCQKPKSLLEFIRYGKKT